MSERQAGKKPLVHLPDVGRQGQITDVHANWSYQGELHNGKFSYQLILDNGAQEVLIMPTADDAKVLRDLINDADTLFWDLDKEVIIFGKIA